MPQHSHPWFFEGSGGEPLLHMCSGTGVEMGGCGEGKSPGAFQNSKLQYRIEVWENQK